MKLINPSVTILDEPFNVKEYNLNETSLTLKFITTRSAALTIRSGKDIRSDIEYGKPIQFIKPTWLDYNNSETLHAFNTACGTALSSYNKLLSLGFSHNLIHDVLPSVVKVNLIALTDIESWRKFIVYPTNDAELRQLQILTRYELSKFDNTIVNITIP